MAEAAHKSFHIIKPAKGGDLMPNRILKESICSSEDIDKLKPFEEIFFYRLIVKCDDFGRYDARPKVLKSALFPIKDGVTAKNVEDALHTLTSLGLVKLYEVEGRPFLFLPTWMSHQTKRAKTSKWPDPLASEITCKQMQADVHVFEKRETRNDIRETRSENAHAHASDGALPRKNFGELKNVFLDDGELSGLYNGHWSKETVDEAIEWYSLYKKGHPEKIFPRDGDYANIKRYALPAVMEKRKPKGGDVNADDGRNTDGDKWGKLGTVL